jgi:hypothetical protein
VNTTDLNALFNETFALCLASHEAIAHELSEADELAARPRIEVANATFRVPAINNGQCLSQGFTVINSAAERHAPRIIIRLDDGRWLPFFDAKEAHDWAEDESTIWVST